ncbi:putative peptidoglycan lipid II flippase [Candidatus Planktophila limnetica]|uniref:Putative peptidoglycan lipid II flippase n=1 Tax=Candidatus Planktophila limnetica TaxID=573600 RepID=A0A249LH29_9ACTN|nr:murein biosynthesis integral membrane protein MurJ [Candidatus Planktophila limnetica]ASY28307.1 putative peptidoglycan lipid II flippase [Candidatus Planktophila limnetica]
MKEHELFRASSVMAVGTIISRITGFIGGVIMIATLGTALLADAFNVANTMPNILYNLLVGGALTAIFVPQLVRAFDDTDGGHLFASRLVTTISGILLALVVIGVIFAPQLVYIYAPSFSTPGFETEREIAIAFTRYCLPQIFFLGLFTMLGQVANARGSFAPLMWAPIANNLVVIVVFSAFLLKWPNVSVDSITDTQIQILGWGTTAGIIIQALILIPVVKKSGIRIRPKWGVAGLGKSFSLAGWTLVYVLISQIGYLITVNVATTAAVESAKAGITTGVGFTPFKNAYLIMLLPYSIVTISIVTALLPHMSKLAINKKIDDVKDQLLRAIKTVGVLTIPSSVAFLLFGPLITEVLFFGIDKNDGIYIGYVLSALSLGLVAFSINLVLIRGFNAFEDTRTQVWSILIINFISVGLSYLFLAILPSDWVTVGLGFAFSASYLIGLFITLRLLKKHTGVIHIRDFIGQHGRLLSASLIAMLPIFAISQYFGWVGSDQSSLVRASELLFVIVAGALGYFFAAKALRISEVSGITALILRRNKAAE